MFNIPHFIEKIKSIIRDENYFNIPIHLEEGLNNQLEEGETVRFKIRLDRAQHKASSFFSGNTYYKVFLFLTDNRIFLIRNSKTFKKFRDFKIAEISTHSSELDDSVPKLSLVLPNSEYIFFFPFDSGKDVENLFEIINTLVSESVSNKGESSFCRFCGAEIPFDSLYCNSCGKKL